MGIMDLRTKKSLSEDGMGDNNKKSCTDCQTTKTPLWRGGPAGPKSLCNACGIRYRKKRREMLGLDKGFEKKDRKKKKKERSSSDSSQSSSVVTTNDDGSGDKKTDSAKVNGPSETVKMSLFAVGSDLLLQRSSSSSSSTITFSTSLSGVVKKQRCQRRRRLGEVEQAAINLMALSCDSVFA